MPSALLVSGRIELDWDMESASKEGYETFMNVMAVSTLTPDEVDAFLDRLRDSGVHNVAIVDSFGTTLYHLLGINPATVLTAQSGRPVKLIAEDAPIIKEALA